LTRKSALYSSVVVRRIFYFPLVLAIDARTGFFTCSFDINSWLTLFRIEKVSKSWSFWSVIRTSLLSYSCFFLLLVKVELGVLLVTLLEGEGVEDGDKEGREDEEGRSLFSLFVLRTLLDKCHNYLERSLRSWWTWHRPQWNLLSHVTKNSKQSHMMDHMILYAVYAVYGLYAHVQHVQHVHHVQEGFLRS